MRNKNYRYFAMIFVLAFMAIFSSHAAMAQCQPSQVYIRGIKYDDYSRYTQLSSAAVAPGAFFQISTSCMPLNGQIVLTLQDANNTTGLGVTAFRLTNVRRNGNAVVAQAPDLPLFNNRNYNVGLFVYGAGLQRTANPGALRITSTAVPGGSGGTLLSGSSNNLVTNGSFETGAEPGGFTAVQAGGSMISGWRVLRGQVDYIGTYWRASDGRRSIDMNGTPGAGTIAQSFRTAPGTSYRLLFDLGVNPECEPEMKRLQVTVGRVSQVYSQAKAGRAGTWQTKSIDFVANSATTTLMFASLDGPSDRCGATIDNVRVFATR